MKHPTSKDATPNTHPIVTPISVFDDMADPEPLDDPEPPLSGESVTPLASNDVMFCTTSVPLGSPFLIKLVLSTD